MSGEIYQCYCMRRPQYLLDISSDRSISGSAAVARVAGAGGKLAASVGNVTRTTRLNTVDTVSTVDMYRTKQAHHMHRRQTHDLEGA